MVLAKQEGLKLNQKIKEENPNYKNEDLCFEEEKKKQNTHHNRRYYYETRRERERRKERERLDKKNLYNPENCNNSVRTKYLSGLLCLIFAGLILFVLSVMMTFYLISEGYIFWYYPSTTINPFAVFDFANLFY